MTEEKTYKVSIFTDGACLGNPGPGGWAAILRCNGVEKEMCGGFARTTNNRMELTAALEGLQALTSPCEVELYSDSRYLCDAVEKKWIWGWRNKGWKKADGKPVLNQDLWLKIIPQLGRHSVKLRWVAGHSGHAENERVDTLARNMAGQKNLPPDAGFEG